MFNKRIWLNNKKSASTGSAVAFSGKRKWRGKTYNEMFFEITDCNDLVRLHRTEDDKTKQFIKKLKKLRNLLDKFINYLETENEDIKNTF